MKASLYTRPNKPKAMIVTKRRGQVEPPSFEPLPELVEVDRATECHVTPPEIAERMADYLGVYYRYKTLEPSAGTGNLIQAVFDCSEEAPVIVAVEQHYNLVNVLEKRFSANDVRLNQSCFLDFAKECGEKYHRIIMNPPFKNIKKHMNAAIDLLESEDARLIALVPITYQHEEAQTLEELGPDTFASAKVNTKIIEIER